MNKSPNANPNVGPPWRNRKGNRWLSEKEMEPYKKKAVKLGNDIRGGPHSSIRTPSQIHAFDEGFGNEAAPFWRESSDGSDSLVNKKFQFLQFYHLPSGHAVAFKAFVTRYEDTYNSEWNAQPVYGRMDPIATFRRTGRVINAGFTIPSDNIQEAFTNLQRISELIRFLYPSYDSANGTIKGAPFLKLQFMNWAQKSGNGPGTDPKESGLLGYVNGFQFAPDLDAGVHQSGLEIYPKAMTVNFRFTVIHEQLTGWVGDTFIAGGGKFPYGVGGDKYLAFTNETMTKNQKELNTEIAKSNASIILNG